MYQLYVSTRVTTYKAQIVKQLRENLKVSSIPNKDSSDSETLILGMNGFYCF